MFIFSNDIFVSYFHNFSDSTGATPEPTNQAAGSSILTLPQSNDQLQSQAGPGQGTAIIEPHLHQAPHPTAHHHNSQIPQPGTVQQTEACGQGVLTSTILSFHPNEPTAFCQTCHFLYDHSITLIVATIKGLNWILINPRVNFLHHYVPSMNVDQSGPGTKYALVIKKTEYSAHSQSVNNLTLLLWSMC